jgi:hypothetical protein
LRFTVQTVLQGHSGSQLGLTPLNKNWQRQERLEPHEERSAVKALVVGISPCCDGAHPERSISGLQDRTGKPLIGSALGIKAARTILGDADKENRMSAANVPNA